MIEAKRKAWLEAKGLLTEPEEEIQIKSYRRKKLSHKTT